METTKKTTRLPYPFGELSKDYNHFGESACKDDTSWLPETKKPAKVRLTVSASNNRNLPHQGR